MIESPLCVLFNAAADGIILMDVRGTITMFNPAAEQMFGYAAAEVVGDDVKRLIPQSYHGEHDRYLDNYRLTGHREIIGIRREMVGLRKSGETFPMDLSVSAAEQDGQIVYIGILRDVSERKRSNELREQLTAMNDRLKLALGGWGLGIFDIDEVSGQVIADEAVEQLFGAEPGSMNCSVDEIRAKFFIEDLPVKVEQLAAAAVAGLSSAALDLRIRCPNGEIRDLHGVRRLIYSEEGVHVRTIGVYRDHTELKRAEAAAQKHQIETAALQKRVQDQRLTVDLFNHALAHDLREPVRTVRSFAELICAGEIGDERRDDYMRLIRDAGDRMAMLIDTVSTYTELDGAIAPSREIFDLNDAASDAAANLFALFSNHGATVSIGTLPFVTANRVQVTQALQNLMSNAASHSPKPVQIWIQAEAEGGSVRVVVRDNGPGISPKNQREIFTPFRRFNRDNRHSGLGLAITQKIVEAHGGKIGCNSIMGEGSSFHFTLPGVLASIDEPVTVERGATPAMIESPPQDLANVLIVDDHDGEILLARVHLTEPGAMRCNLLVAHDGEEGLALIRDQSARKDPVDLILLDINMPGMGGFEMLEALAEDATYGRIPVVMCSGSMREEDKVRSRELGAVAYLVKTVRFEQLKPVIAALASVRLALDENGTRSLVRAA